MAVESARLRFSIAQYERMVEAGILEPDDRVELIEGEILEMVPPSPDHSTVTSRLTRLFVRGAGERAVVRVQDAIRLPPRSMPEPDLVLARSPDDRYLKEHPGPEDVLLVVEVSYTTTRRDRETEVSLYARHGIREAWVVDVPGRRFEIHREPAGETYGQVQIAGPGETVSPATLPDLEIAIDEVLP